MTITDSIIAAIAKNTGVDADAAQQMRYYAHNFVSRGGRATYTSRSNGLLWENDEAIEAAGFAVYGKNNGSALVTLTAAGEAMARRIVSYETRYRARHMDADGFAEWQRRVAAV